MSRITRVFFLIPSLRAGGAERVASLLMNEWYEDKHYEIIACTFDPKKNDFYLLHKGIKRLTIEPLEAPQDLLGRLALITKRLIVMRRLLKQTRPDVIVSFLDRPGLLSILASWGLGIPVIVSERTNPRFYNDGNLYDKIKKKLFSWRGVFVAQTKEIASWASQFMSPEKIFVIPNPVSPEFERRIDVQREPIILSVGRLCMEKGFDMLIEAFAKIAAQYPQWKLIIVGGGEEEKRLRTLIVQHNLKTQVFLPGASSNTKEYLNRASIYVTSSRVEGFPNALLEAMAAGVPPISFDFSCGPRDIIDHQKNGLLVRANDIEKLAESMAYLIENGAMREILGQNAEKVREIYSLQNIAERWKDILQMVKK